MCEVYCDMYRCVYGISRYISLGMWNIAISVIVCMGYRDMYRCVYGISRYPSLCVWDMAISVMCVWDIAIYIALHVEYRDICH